MKIIKRPLWHIWLNGAIPYMAVLIGMYLWHNAIAAMLLYHGGILIALHLAPDRPAPAIMIQGFHWQLLLLLPLYALPGFLIYQYWAVAGSIDTNLASMLQSLGIAPGHLLGFAIYYVVVNAALEEYFWRGLLFEHVVLPTLADLLFAGYHGIVMALFVTPAWTLLTVALLLITSWLWRLMVLKTRGAIIPWLTHVVADAAIMTSVFLLTSN
jgi:membrane protease YdiL (CAAX protease family)